MARYENLMIESKMGSNWTIGGGDEPETAGAVTATLAVVCTEDDVIWLCVFTRGCDFLWAIS